VLFAKISPAAEVPAMISPFEYQVKIADYVTALADQYRLGASQAVFNIRYGLVTLNEAGAIVKFETLLTDRIVLEGQDIADWGTDDSVVLAKICEKLGTEAIEFVEADIDLFN